MAQSLVPYSNGAMAHAMPSCVIPPTDYKDNSYMNLQTTSCDERTMHWHNRPSFGHYLTGSTDHVNWRSRNPNNSANPVPSAKFMTPQPQKPQRFATPHYGPIVPTTWYSPAISNQNTSSLPGITPYYYPNTVYQCKKTSMLLHGLSNKTNVPKGDNSCISINWSTSVGNSTYISLMMDATSTAVVGSNSSNCSWSRSRSECTDRSRVSLYYNEVSMVKCKSLL